jgi:hypothetical protein
VPINETTPLNAGLFPPGQAVELATLPIPAFCDENFTTFNFQVNAALFPAQGISHIFFTRTDNLQGDVYLAVDDICLALQLRSCCASQPDFEQVIESEVSINVDVDACSATLQTGNLPDCDAISEINWGDGNTSAGPFAANVSVAHSYQDGGNYSVSFTAVETGVSGQNCFQTTRTQVIGLACTGLCACGIYSGMTFSPTQGGGVLNFNCGTDIPLPCQPGVTYTVSGSFICQGVGCPGSVPVSWTLNGPQGLVAASTTTANPAFSIQLPSGLFYVAGTYALTFNANCNGFNCPCTVYFVVSQPCPALCPCDLADFQADVLAGFLTTHYYFPTCKACFKGIALGPCDMVEWSVDNGPFSAPIPGTQKYCFNFAGNGTHFIQMRVTRKKGVNLICETFTFAKTITINCNPIPITIGGPRVYNPGSQTPVWPLAPGSETEFRVTDSTVPGEKTVLRIFPNPNTGTFSVELSEPAPAGLRFRIVGITGQVMQEQVTQTGSKLQPIQTGDLPGGLYFLQVVSEGRIFATEKFVKQ